ncbi:MAG: S8 family serine peptidase [Chloroflexota bacterium]
MRTSRLVHVCSVVALLLTLLPSSTLIAGQISEVGIVTSPDGSSAVLRQEPWESAAIVGHIEDGAEVRLHGVYQDIEVGDWALVETADGRRGFIAQSNLAPSSVASEATMPREAEQVQRRVATATTVPRASEIPPRAASHGASTLIVPTRVPLATALHGNDRAPVTQGVAVDKHKKLDTLLARAARVERERGPTVAIAEARQGGLKTVNGLVRVVISAVASTRGQVATQVAALGGRAEAEYANLIQALVPVSALQNIANRTDVLRVAPPLRPVSHSVLGEEVPSTGAMAWQINAVNGAGVKVAIIDLGFAGLSARQAAGDLPNTVVTQDFCAGGFDGPEDHGTAVAEIVHEMAPQAQLYLVCVGTQVELGQALNYAKAQGVHIINHSVGWYNSSRGDGSGAAGSPDAIVADARSNGILWVNSAGNASESHWSGTFSDTDSPPDDFHNFSGTDQGNTVTVDAGGDLCVFLKWDNWPTSTQDYDLYLALSSTGASVATSTFDQTGGAEPTEGLCYTNTGPTQNFFIAIEKFSANQTPRLDIFKFGGSPLEYPTPAGSVTEPASSPHAFAVGAHCWQNDAIEPFSSQGPTIDGRIKPDIIGPDRMGNGTAGNFVNCSSFSGFAGTSAAAPTVAGAAALVKQANPSFVDVQIQAFLESRAVDLGAGGKDNVFGVGKLSLGAPPSSCPSPRPHVQRSITPVSSGRLQVSLGAGHGLIGSITATKLTSAHVEFSGGTLTSNGQSMSTFASSPTFFIQRVVGSGAYTAELSITDGCGTYPLFFGAGS